MRYLLLFMTLMFSACTKQNTNECADKFAALIMQQSRCQKLGKCLGKATVFSPHTEKVSIWYTCDLPGYGTSWYAEDIPVALFTCEELRRLELFKRKP